MGDFFSNEDYQEASVCGQEEYVGGAECCFPWNVRMLLRGEYLSFMWLPTFGLIVMKGL